MTLPLLLVKYGPFRWQLSQLQLYPDHTPAETPQSASEVQKVLDTTQIIVHLYDTATESCTICLEDVALTSPHVVGGCLHRFCVSCLQTHTHKKLEDRQYPIPCPHPGCGTGIADAECDSILRSTQDRQLLAEVNAQFVNLTACWQVKGDQSCEPI